MLRLRFPFACSTLLLAGCAAAPAALDLPPTAPTVCYSAAGDGAATTAKAVRIELLALRAAPRGPSVELSALAIVTDRPAPFRGASRLPAGTLWLDANATAEWLAASANAGPVQLQRLGQVDAVVASNFVTVVSTHLGPLPDLRFECIENSTRILLVVGGDHDPSRDADPGADADRRDHDGTQHLLLRDPLPSRGACLCFVPVQHDHIAGYAILASQCGEASGAAIAAANAACPTPASEGAMPSAERQRRLALHAIGAHNRRAALLGIAQQLACARCIDLLVTADEPHLIAIGNAVCQAEPSAPGYAWSFERAAWSALLPSLQRDELPPALVAALLRHFGALGTDATLLELLLHGSADETVFAAAVRDENLAALDDRSDAVRVRAHDWLSQHGVTVADYAPLEPRAQRRAALRRHTSAQLAAAQPAGPTDAAAAATAR